MSATAVRCTVCGGATGVRADAVRHRCEFCGSEFVWAATHQAAGEAERRVRAALAQIESELDALDAAARQHAAAGDVDGAYRLVADHVHRVGEIYRQTGYYAVMGVDTAEAIETTQRAAYQVHLQRLGLVATPAAPTDGPAARMAAGCAQQNFELALAGYTAMIDEQLAGDPRWRGRDPAELAQVRASSIRTFALGLPFATAADLARHGIELAQPVTLPDGTHVVRCVQCGADVALAQLAETVTCAHCRATFRIRLEGVAVYHARGYTDVTEHDVARQQQATGVAAGDLSARVELARGITAGMTARDATHRSEYTFVYALELGAPLGGTEQAAIAALLGLAAPTTCRACSRTIALGVGTTVCPMCSARL